MTLGRAAQLWRASGADRTLGIEIRKFCSFSADRRASSGGVAAEAGHH
jgi:hypothetical protein